MLRTITIAAALAALAGSACAAETIHVHTAGKSSQEVQAEVHKAAVYLCSQQAQGSILQYYGQQQCVAKTVQKTFAQAGFGVASAAGR